MMASCNFRTLSKTENSKCLKQKKKKKKTPIKEQKLNCHQTSQ